MTNDIREVKYYKVVEKKYFWLGISTCIIIIGFLLMGYRFMNNQPMLNYGLDFTGGSSLLIKIESLDTQIKTDELQKEHKTQKIQTEYISKIRGILEKFQLEKSRIQATQDHEILIRTQEMKPELREKILTALKSQLGNITLLEAYEIGPTLGKELQQMALWLIFFCTIGMTLYITWRFEFAFGVGALGSLLHDALIMISFAAILNMELDSAFIAAILTVLGYSINDTIVVYDRIRENLGAIKQYKLDFGTVINISVTQVLRRSLYTSCTVLLALIPLLIFGGTTIKGFTWVLFVGVVSGTYSSIFIAIPILMMLSPKEDA